MQSESRLFGIFFLCATVIQNIRAAPMSEGRRANIWAPPSTVNTSHSQDYSGHSVSNLVAGAPHTPPHVYETASGNALWVTSPYVGSAAYDYGSGELAGEEVVQPLTTQGMTQGADNHGIYSIDASYGPALNLDAEAEASCASLHFESDDVQEVIVVQDDAQDDDEVIVIPHPSRTRPQKPDNTAYRTALQAVGDAGMEEVVRRYQNCHPRKTYDQAKRDVRQGVNAKWARGMLSENVNIREKAAEMIGCLKQFYGSTE